MRKYRFSRGIAKAGLKDYHKQPQIKPKFVTEFGKRFADLATKWAPQGAAFLELSRIPYFGAYSFQERVVAREPDEPARAEPLAPYLAIVAAVVHYGVKHCGLPLKERVSDRSTLVATAWIRRPEGWLSRCQRVSFISPGPLASSSAPADSPKDCEQPV
jgi:hypothetical protein